MAEDYTSPKTHLTFRASPEHLRFAGTGRGPKTHLRPVDRAQHAARLQHQVNSIDQVFAATAQARENDRLSAEFGLILNVISAPGFDLAFTSLEKSATAKAPAIVLLNLRHENTNRGLVTKAAIFVPHGQLKVLGNKIAAYATKNNKDKEGNPTGPKNARLLANIASITVAAFEALWTDPEPLPEGDDLAWFELWIRKDTAVWEAQFDAECGALGLEPPQQKLQLPEHVVVVIHSTRRTLESSLDLLNTLSEARRARPCSVGLTDLSGTEQDEWVDEALDRILWPSEDAPAVCIIDSGVNRGHRLLEPLLLARDSESVFTDGSRADDLEHGTPMAGLAAYGDLRHLMLSTGIWQQLHRLESVKVLRDGASHDPDNYGYVTLQAIALPEIANAERKRVYCMAITARGPNTRGNPSSWSSAIDMAAAGAEDETAPARMIILSAGNVREHPLGFDYPEDLIAAPIENPAQAWNAITVGAVTQHTSITEADDEAQRSVPVAPLHGISPFSRTSHQWRRDWPIRPDIVMEGGNLALNSEGEPTHFASLQPLSTAASFRLRPLTAFNATSAAAALAARQAALLTQRYPEYQPETIRGLLVHAARWPDELLQRQRVDPHAVGSSSAVESLLRSYGFGSVEERRLLQSFENQTTLVTEGSIQPYQGEWDDPKLNECHLIALPWPRQILEDHPDHPVTLKVTLSYFITPNPGSRTWAKSQKYHYASCLLRFKVKHKDMSTETFRARLDADTESERETYKDPGWALGGHLRGKCGSLVQDVWKGTSGELAEMGHIGIYPAKGWWAYRRFSPSHELHGCHRNHVNYSLIVSVDTTAQLPIYTEVAQAITSINTQAAIDALF